MFDLLGLVSYFAFTICSTYICMLLRLLLSRLFIFSNAAIHIIYLHVNWIQTLQTKLPVDSGVRVIDAVGMEIGERKEYGDPDI